MLYWGCENVANSSTEKSIQLENVFNKNPYATTNEWKKVRVLKKNLILFKKKNQLLKDIYL